MNRQRERAIIGGICQKHGVTRETCTHYAMLLEALLTDGVDEIIRGRMEDGPQSGPVVAAMRRAGMRPMPSVWGAIEAQAKAEGITPQAAYESAQAWLMNGYKAENVTGALEWAKLGTRSGRDSKPQAPVRYSPSDPADLYGGQP